MNIAKNFNQHFAVSNALYRAARWEGVCAYITSILKMKSKMRKRLKLEFDEDTRLMQRAANGDFSAFVTLYERYFRIVMDYLASLDGNPSSLEDYVQIVFLRIWQNRGKFRGDSTFKTYLFGVARNVLSENNYNTPRKLGAE